jgi:hypothetical protein
MSRALFHPVTWVLGIMCIQWVVLAQSGPYTLKVPYVALALVIAFAASNMRRVRAAVWTVRQNWPWLLPFLLYMVLLSTVLFGSGVRNPGPRQFLYILGCVGIAASLAAATKASTILRTGGALAVILFVVVVELMARKLGLSWADAVRAFLTSGDLHFIVFSFLRPVFNSLDPTGDVTFVASQKNAIAACLLVSTLLFRSAWPKPSRDWVGWAHMGAVLFLLLMLNTRSVLIAAALGIMLAMSLRTFLRSEPTHWLLLKGLVALAAVIVAMGYIEASPVSDLMTDRFAFDDASAAARELQYSVALQKIADSPILGSGYQVVNGYVIHNLFLSAWVNAGILAFLLVLCFYLLLIARWLGFIWALVRRPEDWVLPLAPEWIAPLPLLPLFRVWISGDGGNPFLGEWIALGCFAGLVLANDLRRWALSGMQAGRAPGSRLRPGPAIRRGPLKPVPALINSAGNKIG